VGDTNLAKNNGIDDKLNRLLGKIEPPPKTEEAADDRLNNINEVVGATHEEDILREHLFYAPEEWNRFPEASEDTIKKICTSIYHYGLLHRITVWKQPDGKYMILGGRTRTTCFDYLYDATNDVKYRKIPAVVYEYDQLSMDDAHRIFIVSNTDQRTMSIKTISSAYCDLMMLEKKKSFYGSGIYSRDAAAKLANVAPTTFTTYLNLSKLYTPLLNEADHGNITVMTAYQLSLLPKDLQQYIFDSGVYIDLSTPAAKKLKEATTKADIDKILKDLREAPKYYKYTVSTKFKKPSGKEVIPLFIDKKEKKEVVDYLSAKIKESKFSKETIQALLDTLNN
jgi:hypothetical protein